MKKPPDELTALIKELRTLEKRLKIAFEMQLASETERLNRAISSELAAHPVSIRQFANAMGVKDWRTAKNLHDKIVSAPQMTTPDAVKSPSIFRATFLEEVEFGGATDEEWLLSDGVDTSRVSVNCDRREFWVYDKTDRTKDWTYDTWLNAEKIRD